MTTIVMQRSGIQKSPPLARRVANAARLLFSVARAAFALAFILALAAGAFLTARAATKASFFSLASVSYTGARTLDIGEIASLAGPLMGENIFGLSLPAIGQKIERHPWIRAVAIRKEWPDRLVIQVTEREPVARINVAGAAWLMDGEGTLIEETPGKASATLPVITGVKAARGALTAGDIVELGHLAPAFQAIRELAGFRLFGKSPLAACDVSNPWRVTLSFAGTKTRVIAPATAWTDEGGRLRTVDYLLRAKSQEVVAINLMFPDKVIVSYPERGNEER